MKQYLFIALIFTAFSSFSQSNIHDEADKCGQPSEQLKSGTELLGDRWGYSYDNLLADINVWGQDKNTDIRSIGNTAQNRKIFELTVTDPNVANSAKHRIYLHARTHPNEVQSFKVVKEMIRLATADDEFGKYLRANFIIHFVPMYNPDGVEAELERLNGNSVNLETNWDASAPEEETKALRARFIALMQESPAISVALNMHSAYDCTRYFVYHAPYGTSDAFAEKEQQFINSIRDNFTAGIKPYDYYISWSYSNPTQYPESWWWSHYREQVMALTYEDMNCSTAGNYLTTATAILKGMTDYLDRSQQLPINSVTVYFNPNTSILKISWKTSAIPQKISVIDPLGKVFAQKDALDGNTIEIDMSTAVAGQYDVVTQIATETVHSTVIKKSQQTATSLLADNLTIYPNPLENTLNITWDGPSIPQKITVTDLLGNTIAQAEALAGNSQEIDMSTAASGMYVVLTQFASETVHTAVVKR